MAERKRVFINASTVLFSGGLILTRSIIETLIKDGLFELYITCPRQELYKQFITNHAKIRVVPHWMLNRLVRWIHDYFWLPKLIRNINPDLVFTLGNIPARTTFKQIFLHDNPYLTEKSFAHIPLPLSARLIHKLRCILTLRRMRFVSLIVAQTEYQKQKLKVSTNNRVPIKLITPAVPIVYISDKTASLPFSFPKNKTRILCLSRYYEHKNIEILLKLALLIKVRNLPFVIYLTISENQGKKAVHLNRSITSENIHDVLVNLGHFHSNQVPDIIKQTDAIILPSLLESFSLTCIEAWHYRKPLFISDMDSMHSSCRNAAFYFNPYSASDILNCLTNAWSNPDNISAMVHEGEKRLKELSEWSDYIAVLKYF